MQAILLRQFRAWHERGPEDGSGSVPRSGVTAKPGRPSAEGMLEARGFRSYRFVE